MSRDWDRDFVDLTGVGEVYGETRHYNARKAITGLLGDHQCGTADEFAHGITYDPARPPCERDANGFPLCCEAPVPFIGLVADSASSVLVTNPPTNPLFTFATADTNALFVVGWNVAVTNPVFTFDIQGTATPVATFDTGGSTPNLQFTLDNPLTTSDNVTVSIPQGTVTNLLTGAANAAIINAPIVITPTPTTTAFGAPSLTLNNTFAQKVATPTSTVNWWRIGAVGAGVYKLVVALNAASRLIRVRKVNIFMGSFITLAFRSSAGEVEFSHDGTQELYIETLDGDTADVPYTFAVVAV
jgi:hypothetical protein